MSEEAKKTTEGDTDTATTTSQSGENELQGKMSGLNVSEEQKTDQSSEKKIEVRILSNFVNRFFSRQLISHLFQLIILEAFFLHHR